MRTVCIVQARMGNSRLPGKNGALILGLPQIWHVLNRVKQARGYQDVMMAIPYESNGKILVSAAQSLGVEVLNYRGDPNDLVHRYALAADIMDADIVVRIPGDNTFVDPDEVDRLINVYNEVPSGWNWLTTNLDRDVHGNGYPGGLGCEIYDSRFLRWLDKSLVSARLREHPHKWAFENHLVRTIQAPQEIRLPGMKFSVDTEEELQWTREIYAAIYPDNPNFRTRDILEYLNAKSDISRI